MNEKIKQLATESKLMSIIEELDLEIINAHDVSRVEKFAELIVRECLEACSRANEIRHFVPPTQEQVVLSCMDEIERTFRT